MTSLNTSGFVPFDTRVVILLDPVEDKFTGTSLHIPDQVKEKQKYAQTVATLIAVGDNAFIEWGERATKPQPGDRIVAGRYVGNQHKGADGKDYTVCNDQDILALWRGN